MDTCVWISLTLLMTLQTDAMMMQQSQNNIPQEYQQMSNNVPNRSPNIPNMPPNYANMPSGMTNGPSGMNNMPSGMNNMPSGMNNMPSGTNNMRSGMNNMPSGMNNMPSSMNNMPSGMNSMPSGMNSMPSGMNNMPSGMPPMPPMFNMPPMPPNLAALTSMLPGYPCEAREAPCPGDQICRMAATGPCFRPPCPPPVVACLNPAMETSASGASCPMGSPILSSNRMTEMQCGAGRGQCPAKTFCHIDMADNIYMCCWEEQNSNPFSGGWPRMSPNPSMQGFPPRPPTNALAGLGAMGINTRMPPRPSLNMQPPLNQNNGQNMWQQNRPSSSGMFPNGPTGNRMFPQTVQSQQGRTQGATPGRQMYQNGAMPGFSTAMSTQYPQGSPGMFPPGQQGGSQPMFPANTQQGYMLTGQNQFQKPNQPMFSGFPSGPGGYPNNSQMGFQGPQNMGVPYGIQGQYPNQPFTPPYGQWSPNGLPPTFQPTPGPGSSQSNQSNTHGVPQILIPGSTFDKHKALQDALKSIASGQQSASPGTDQSIPPTAAPDGQNETSSSDNTTTPAPVYASSEGIWSPQQGSTSVNVLDTLPVSTNATGPVTVPGTVPGTVPSMGPGTVPSTLSGTVPGTVPGMGPDTVSPQLPVGAFPSTSQQIGQPNTGTLYPPTVTPNYSNYWQQNIPSPQGQFPGPSQGPSPGQYPPQYQNPVVKPGQCPQVYAVGYCRDSCQTDRDCLFTFKCCFIGTCKTCMHEEMTRTVCSFLDKMRGIC